MCKQLAKVMNKREREKEGERERANVSRERQEKERGRKKRKLTITQFFLLDRKKEKKKQFCSSRCKSLDYVHFFPSLSLSSCLHSSVIIYLA